MRLRFTLLTVIAGAVIGGCSSPGAESTETYDPDTWVIRIEAPLGFPEIEDDLALCWSDGACDHHEAGDEDHRRLAIERRFDSAAAARAFEGSFHTEGFEPADWFEAGGAWRLSLAACDRVVDLGYDATRVRIAEANLREGSLRCVLGPPGGVPFTPGAGLVAWYTLPLPVGTAPPRFLFDGVEVQPYAVTLNAKGWWSDDRIAYTLGVQAPAGPPTAEPFATLHVFTGDEDHGALPLTLEPCLSHVDEGAKLTSQHLELALDGWFPFGGGATEPGLQVNLSAGGRCGLSDGTTLGWIP
jgi:hypothetical protein